MSVAHPPRLVFSELSGHFYVLTRYTVRGVREGHEGGIKWRLTRVSRKA